MPKLGYKQTKEHRENNELRLANLRTVVKSAEYRKKMSNTKKGKPLPIDSLVGASESNKNCKDWWFLKDGKHYRFRSLNKFVRDNKHLFSQDELTEYKTEGRTAKIYRATVMLRNLHLLDKNGNPRIPSHEWNGWTIGEKWEQGYYTQSQQQ